MVVMALYAKKNILGHKGIVCQEEHTCSSVAFPLELAIVRSEYSGSNFNICTAEASASIIDTVDANSVMVPSLRNQTQTKEAGSAPSLIWGYTTSKSRYLQTV
jgi:hypothetical protein